MVTTKIYLENIANDPTFNFGSRIVGRRGINLQWIVQQSGADFVTLKGREGKTAESMNNINTTYVHIVAKSEASMAKAIYLVKDLITFVKHEYLAFTARKSAGMTHLLLDNLAPAERRSQTVIDFTEIKKQFVEVAPNLFLAPEFKDRKSRVTQKIVARNSLR